MKRAKMRLLAIACILLLLFGLALIVGAFAKDVFPPSVASVVDGQVLGATYHFPFGWSPVSCEIVGEERPRCLCENPGANGTIYQECRPSVSPANQKSALSSGAL